MNQKMMVSVVCMTYNHEAYIGNALEGFVSQKTNFAYEVIVHDDASTDKTADIIREYEKKYPELIKTSVYKGYKQDKIEMRGDRAEMSDFPLYLNTVAGGLDRRDQTIGGFSFVVKIYAVPVVEIIG